MSRVSTGDARATVSFRISKPQLALLDDYATQYQQGRGELIREAVQVWLNGQRNLRGLPTKEATPDAVL